MLIRELEKYNLWHRHDIILTDEQIEKIQEFCDWVFAVNGNNIEVGLIELLDRVNRN
jgi:hypothetical protein